MARPLQWTQDLAMGIALIDEQHQRIVDFINQLNEARAIGDRKLVGGVLAGLTDYTISHFGFEEAAMAEAQFKDGGAHRRGHERFVRQLAEYGHRYALGEEVAAELLDTLNKWLVNHIKRDDRDYLDVVKARLDDKRLSAILADCQSKQAKAKK